MFNFRKRFAPKTLSTPKLPEKDHLPTLAISLVAPPGEESPPTSPNSKVKLIDGKLVICQEEVTTDPQTTDSQQLFDEYSQEQNKFPEQVIGQSHEQSPENSIEQPLEHSLEHSPEHSLETTCDPPEDSILDCSQFSVESYLNPPRQPKRSRKMRIITKDFPVLQEDSKVADLVYITRRPPSTKTKSESLPEHSPLPVKSPPAAVPRLKLNAYGQVIIDPESLTIDAKETAEIHMQNAVTEDSVPRGYANYRRILSSRQKWTRAESRRFLMALGMFGTDFSAIASVFPGRRHRDILNKYKSGLRSNPVVIYEMLRKRIKVDYDYFKNAED